MMTRLRSPLNWFVLLTCLSVRVMLLCNMVVYILTIMCVCVCHACCSRVCVGCASKIFHILWGLCALGVSTLSNSTKKQEVGTYYLSIYPQCVMYTLYRSTNKQVSMFHILTIFLLSGKDGSLFSGNILCRNDAENCCFGLSVLQGCLSTKRLVSSKSFSYGKKY